MDTLSNKINKNTIKFVNKTYKKLSTLQCERTYSSHYNHYDEKIDNNIDKVYYLLDEIYQASIEKKAVNDMELYHDDSDIPDVQGTFDECITPRTPRTVQEPHTPTAPVKARKKIIVEEHDVEGNDVEENDVEEDNVLNHIMNYSDDDSDDDSDDESDDESDDSYEKISDEEDDKRIPFEKLSKIEQKQYHMFMKIKVEEYKKTYPQSNIFYDDIYNIRRLDDEQVKIMNTFNMEEVIEQMSLEDYVKKYPDANITSMDNGNYKITHYNGETKELVSTGMLGDHDMGFTDIYSSYPYPYPYHH
jgi:hypothetical protein